MFHAIIAALATAAADTEDPAVGAWGNISISGFKLTKGTTSSTITFTSGGPREILVTHDITTGELTYTINSGTYEVLSSGDTFSVTTGQTVTFQYACNGSSESATVTVVDNDLAATIDTFTCAFTYTGS